MYKIYADNTLIYDSTIEDFKIGKGTVSLEVGKSGSFVFSIYPEHFYYDAFVRLKTVITVYKRGRIVFRGRILNDVTDHWNNKVITCEGELGFLQDSIIRPFTFRGTPENFLKKLVDEHNAQVDEFKRFKIGTFTVVDTNNYFYRSNSQYETAFKNLKSSLPESDLGGYFYITHGEDGKDPIPTLNYVEDFVKTSSQTIEFGQNLAQYTKTVKAEEIATAIIPLGAKIDDGDENTVERRVTISGVNNNVDYVYSEEGVALYGWIFKVVEWDDVTIASNLKAKALEYLESVVKQNVTIELSAIDLNLLDESIESLNVCEYVRVLSTPHFFDATLLCNKQTMDLLSPNNDRYSLGYNYSTFTEKTNKISPEVTKIVDQNLSNVTNKINVVDGKVVEITQNIYYPDTNQLDGSKVQPGTIGADQVAYEDVFAENITMNGKFITSKSVFLEPGIDEMNTLNDFITGRANPTKEDIALYDFNGDGQLTVTDLMTIHKVMVGEESLSTWSKARETTVTIEINLSDPYKAIRLYGTNMWGHYVERCFGAGTPLTGHDVKGEFNQLIKYDEYILELESRIKALETAGGAV